MPSRNAKGLVFGATLFLAGAPGSAWDDYYPRPVPGMANSPTAVQAQRAVRDSIRALPPPDASQDAPGPIPGIPGVPPRLMLRKAVQDSARAAGFPLPRSDAGIYRILTDTGTVLSVGPPVRAGTQGVRILRLMPGGSLRADTLSLDRIRSIGLPHHALRSGMDWVAMAGLLALPIGFSQGVPLPLLAGFQAGIGATGLMPDWASRPPVEFLDHPHIWSGTLAMTQGLAVRSSLNPSDLRAEAVPAFRIQADAGPRWSPLSFGLSIRMLSMVSPLNREDVDDTAWTGDFPRRFDSAYSAHARDFVISPSIAVVWAENPAYTVRTRVPGVLASISAAASARRFVPGFQLEQDLDRWQSLGLGIAYSRYSDSRFQSYATQGYCA